MEYLILNAELGQISKGERVELVALSLIELGIKLHPVKKRGKNCNYQWIYYKMSNRQVPKTLHPELWNIDQSNNYTLYLQ